MIEALGTDLYSGARWADQYQKELCPEGWNKHQRSGMLFSRGLCTSDYPSEKAPTADVVFRTLHTAVTGGALSVFTNSGHLYVSDLADRELGRDYETKAVFLAPIVSPIADLKSQLPTAFNECGKGANLGDATAGGLFPAGDANHVAQVMGVIQESCR